MCHWYVAFFHDNSHLLSEVHYDFTLSHIHLNASYWFEYKIIGSFELLRYRHFHVLVCVHYNCCVCGSKSCWCRWIILWNIYSDPSMCFHFHFYFALSVRISNYFFLINNIYNIDLDKRFLGFNWSWQMMLFATHTAILLSL